MEVPQKEVVYQLRLATEADTQFLISLYRTTREAELDFAGFPQELRQAFVEQQFGAQSHHYQTFYPGSVQHVIEVAGERAGRLYIFRSEKWIHVLDVLMTPEFRGRGIGTTILESLIDESRRTGIPVLLAVEKYNHGAERLYRKLGFTDLQDDDVYRHMIWGQVIKSDKE